MTLEQISNDYKNWENTAKENGYIFIPSKKTNHKNTINLNIAKQWINCYKNREESTINILFFESVN